MGTRIRARRRGAAGQSLIEYAVLVSAALLGVMAIANLTYRTFVFQAQDIERTEIVF